MGQVLGSRVGCSGIRVVDAVKEVFSGFFEEKFKAVSYVIATVIVLAAFELKIGLKLEWNSVWGCSEFDER